jgi:hypothetical protein
MLEHSAFCYGTGDQFRAAIEPFLAEGIDRSEAILAVTTAGNIELLHERFGKSAEKVEFVDANTWYTTPVAALEAYKAFTDAKLRDGAHWVRIVGEPLWAGRSDSEVRSWTRYESLLNLVFSAYPVSILCPYDERSVAPDIITQAHLTHPQALDKGGISDSLDYIDPGRFALEPS